MTARSIAQSIFRGPAPPPSPAAAAPESPYVDPSAFDGSFAAKRDPAAAADDGPSDSPYSSTAPPRYSPGRAPVVVEDSAASAAAAFLKGLMAVAGAIAVAAAAGMAIAAQPSVSPPHPSLHQRAGRRLYPRSSVRTARAWGHYSRPSLALSAAADDS